MTAPDLRHVTWRQSTLTAYLKCPRRFQLEHVLQLPADHAQAGYASQIGSAVHAALEVLVARAGTPAADSLSREILQDALEAAFCAEVEASHDAGVTTDPDTVEAALERLATTELERLWLLWEDPRLHAIEWTHAEWRFEWSDRYGRAWSAGVDALGRARGYVEAFGADGRGEAVDLAPGEVVLVDWKAGEVGNLGLGYVERAANPQVGFYAAQVERRLGVRPTAFLGALQDLDRPKRPRDEQGQVIPSKTKELNPAWLEATGLSAAEAEGSRKRPKDDRGRPITKWIEGPNPAWVEATSRPKGPVFHLCRTDQSVVAQTVRDAIRGAELGIYPATGALVGECMRCPFRGRCVHADDSANQPTNPQE